MYVKLHNVCDYFVVVNVIVYQYNLSTNRGRIFFKKNLDEYELVRELTT